jgi:6-phospho-beta-glucosidase
MKENRIVVIGGGSQFSIGLCESLVDYGQDLLAGSTIVLLDIKEDHLRIVHKFASRLAEEVGIDMKFEATTDRRKAFEGADFLLTTFRPGSHIQQEQDETIPPKYGLQGNETVGIGGIFMACRVVPVLKEICKDAQEICPEAWIINYTNPTQFVADAVQRISDMRVISLCDGYVDVVDDLAYLLGEDPEDVLVYPAGSNHAMWIVRFTVKGEDGYPILKERLSRMTQAEIDEMFAPPDVIDVLGVNYTYEEIYKQFIRHYYFPFSLKLYQIHGLVPGPRYYWRYLLDQDPILKGQMDGTYVSMAGFYMKHMEPRMFQGLEERQKQASLELQSARREGGGGHGDLAVRVISSMVNDAGETFVINVENKGAVSNLPEDAILELSGPVDRYGAHPFAVGPLPKSILGMQYSLVLSQQLAVDAALSGNRNDLLKAILAHPLVHSVDSAEKAMDELLSLQAEWLPQFRQD